MKKIGIAFFLILLACPLWAKAYGPVRPNESLIQVARKFRPQEATLGQTMIAIYFANPDAFEDGNPHKLKKGSWLTIPEKEKILALSPAQASVALFELNQKYGMPLPPKRAPLRKERLLAQKEVNSKATDVPLPEKAEKNGMLMPTENQVVAPKESSQPKLEAPSSTEPLLKMEEEPKEESKKAITESQPAPSSIQPPLSTDSKAGDKSTAVPDAVHSHTLAQIAPWIGVASILAFLLIFYLLRHERRPQPWEDTDTIADPLDTLARMPKQSLEEEFKENPDRTDLALRLARQYSRYNNVDGLIKLIETAKANPNLQSILPALYRLGKIADPERAIIQGDSPVRDSPLTQATLDVKTLPPIENMPEVKAPGAGRDQDDATRVAQDDLANKESLLTEKESASENLDPLQHAIEERREEESKPLLQDLPPSMENLKGLALAKLYLEKGAIKGAKAILEEIAHSGTPEERKQANLLLSNLIES